MIFVSDVHYQLDYLNSLPQNMGPVVILGDLINWIDYRDGQGIAMDVFGYDNVIKLINLRKEHKFDQRKTLWRELYKTDPDKIAKKMEIAINKQYEDVFHVLKKYEVWFIPGNVDDVDIMNTYSSSSIKNVDGLIIEYDNKKYQRDRKAEYPSIVDQLDDIYHNGIDGWKTTIKATKEKYPK